MSCVRHIVNRKLGSPAFKALGKIGDENFVPGLSRNIVTGSMSWGVLCSNLKYLFLKFNCSVPLAFGYSH